MKTVGEEKWIGKKNLEDQIRSPYSVLHWHDGEKRMAAGKWSGAAINLSGNIIHLAAARRPAHTQLSRSDPLSLYL